jgi:undecaprenyl-diphosphatase
MDWFQALVLGVVQGLTEFMPISSSAHLIIVPWVLGWRDPGLAFDVALHLGTLLAILTYFWRDWLDIIKGFLASLATRSLGRALNRRLAWLLIVGCIPGAVVGVLGDQFIESLFHSPNEAHRASAMLTIAVLLAMLGALLWLAERFARHRRTLSQISFGDAIVIGLAQALALLPGVSRSGSTITAGLAVGLRREVAARFSFLLAAPIIAGAGLKKAYDVLQTGFPAAERLPFLVGFLAAAVVGYLCIAFLLRYLQRNSVNVFVYYRWLLAVGIVLLVLARR